MITKMKDLWIVWAAAAALLFSACRKEDSSSQRYPMVRTATAEVYGERLEACFPGRVMASADVDLSFRIAGPIARIYVEPGRKVRKGEVLAEMDGRDYVLQLEATEAEYRQVKAEAERVIALYEQDGVAANDYDKAIYGLRQITAKYEAHRHAVADVQLCAPFDGYVQKCFFSERETVGAGTPVMSMIGIGAPVVEVHLPAADFVRRGAFETFSCRADLYPDREFPLDLIGTAQKANLNQLYTMRLRFRPTGLPLPSPGMAVEVRIDFAQEKEVRVSVPLPAVFEVERTSRVWVFEAKTQRVAARRVEVSTVLADGRVIVSGGLRAGEVVVAAGVHALQEGDRVEVLPPASPTNVGGLL
jgi:RND family efflux transporter MFP subunit